ncbi:MAG: glycerate kinase [Burkholderiales bacterium PBB4]|nr:MAG: glycerate kinase [Burkholderiales bacterium PBB4]
MPRFLCVPIDSCKPRPPVHPDPSTHPHAFLKHLYEVAVQRVQAQYCVPPALPAPPRGRTVVLGAGKAAAAMAHAVETHWPAQAPLSGLVVTRYGHTPPRPQGAMARIHIVEAAHPVPDAAGLAASQRMLELAGGLTADDLVLCLISGGGSSLLSLPAPGLSLAEKQRITQDLLASGASISEMNCVRKHLSAIKGGRLARACGPAQVVTLLISDVPGDDPCVVASGPTVADPTRCADAWALLQRYGIAVPAAVAQALQSGQLETPKPQDLMFAGHHVEVVATAQQALQAAADVVRAQGLASYILSDAIEGESRTVGQVHAALARATAQHSQPFVRPCVLLSGGETTVTLRPRTPGVPRGRGGRAGEFCMGLTLALDGQPGVYALAADTDGIDGVEDNAGARVGPDTLARARALGLSLVSHMDRNDAYSYFAALEDLVMTGPTFTNVNDFRAILVL